MSDCIFCKIAAGEIPSDRGDEDDVCVAFRDLDPQAPVHLLVIPKVHVDGADAVTGDNSGLVAHIFEVIPGLMRGQGVSGGFRVVTNVGQDGGQSVRHLHFHVLGGRALGWPPG